MHDMRICVQDKFVNFCGHRVFKDIGDLRGCKSLVPNQWGYLNQVELLLIWSGIIENCGGDTLQRQSVFEK